MMEGANHSKRLAFIALSMGFFMVILDVTIVNVALPTISYHLHANLTLLQWVVGGYALTFAGLLLFVGAISDHFGAKRIFQIGLIVFSITSLGCALSQSIAILIAFRLLQGVGGALLLPTSLALINQIYLDQTERAKKIGIWAALGGLACASGPFLGGMLTSQISWRSIFFVNIIIATISFLIIKRCVNIIQPSVQTIQFDYLGQLTGFIAIFSFAYALIEGGIYGWASSLILASFIISFIMLCLFLLIEKRVKNPVIPLNIFHHKETVTGLLVAFILNLCFYGQLFMMPFYFENMRHYSVLLTGLSIFPLPALAIIGSYLGGRLTAKYGGAVVMASGLFIAAVGFLSMLVLQQETPNYLFLIPMLLLIGLGVSLTTPAMTFSAIHSVETERSGIISAILNVCNQVGSLMGVAIFGAIAANTKHFMTAMHITLLISGLFFIFGALLSIVLLGKLKT